MSAGVDPAVPRPRHAFGRALSAHPLTASLAVLVIATLGAGAAVAVIYGAAAGIETGELMLAVGAAGLALAHLAARRRRDLVLRTQFAAGVAIAVGSILAATIVGALLMFVSGHDAVMVAVITVFVGLVAVRAAGLLAGGVLGDVRAIEDGLAAVGEGRRDVRMAVEGRDELAVLAGQADAMVGRLAAEESRAAAADAARRDLVAAASHDLRTPVSALRLLVDAIDDELVDEPTRRRYTQTMGTHIRALGGLIDDLFELSRMQAGEIRWALRQVSVGELVDETVQALHPAAAERAWRSTLACPRRRRSSTPIPRSSSASCSTSCRTRSGTPRPTGPDGPGRRPSRRHDDRGRRHRRGIDPAQRSRVFEPFYRGGADSARSTEGAGLGLAIAKAIVEGHGGRIWIEPGTVGTRVRFTLPVG